MWSAWRSRCVKSRRHGQTKDERAPVSVPFVQVRANHDRREQSDAHSMRKRGCLSESASSRMQRIRTFGRMDRWEMKEIAWILETKGKQVMGFKPPKRDD